MKPVEQPMRLIHLATDYSGLIVNIGNFKKIFSPPPHANVGATHLVAPANYIWSAEALLQQRRRKQGLRTPRVEFRLYLACFGAASVKEACSI